MENREEKYVLLKDVKPGKQGVTQYLMPNGVTWSPNINNVKLFTKEEASEKSLEMTTDDFIVYIQPLSKAKREYDERHR